MLLRVEMPSVEATTIRGQVVEWFKDEGDRIQFGEPLFDAEMTATRLARERRYRVRAVAADAAVLIKLVAPVGVDVDLGATLAYAGTDGSEPLPDRDADVPAFRLVTNLFDT